MKWSNVHLCAQKQDSSTVSAYMNMSHSNNSDNKKEEKQKLRFL